MVDLAVMIIAVAVVVLVGYLVPTILQVKRAVGQSERLLIRVNHELPGLLKDLKGTNEIIRATNDDIRALTEQARVGVDQAVVFLNAVGQVGQTVNQVHQAVRGKGGTVMIGLTSLLAGIKAATSTVKHRVHKESKEKEGGSHYGE